MPDRYVGVLLKDGTKKSVEAWDTASPFLCVAPANDNIRWTIVSIKTGTTFGAFDKVLDAQNVVKILMVHGLDKAKRPVRGKEWDNYPTVTREIKSWILGLSKKNY